MLIDQLIAKLRRELYETSAEHSSHGRAYRDGWNNRAQSPIRELEQMLAEAQTKEQV